MAVSDVTNYTADDILWNIPLAQAFQYQVIYFRKNNITIYNKKDDSCISLDKIQKLLKTVS